MKKVFTTLLLVLSILVLSNCSMINKNENSEIKDTFIRVQMWFIKENNDILFYIKKDGFLDNELAYQVYNFKVKPENANFTRYVFYDNGKPFYHWGLVNENEIPIYRFDKDTDYIKVSDIKIKLDLYVILER